MPNDFASLIVGKAKGASAPAPEHDDAKLEAMKGFISAVKADDAEAACDWFEKIQGGGYDDDDGDEDDAGY